MGDQRWNVDTSVGTQQRSKPESHLSASLVGAAAAISGAKAEAAGAAFRVGRVQVERPHFALIASRSLNVLLQHQRRTASYPPQPNLEDGLGPV